MSRSARSLSHAHPTPTPPANSGAPSRRHRRKMQPPDCISRYDRIISGKRRLKRLPAARLHRKTGVIPDYNVTAVSRRFTIRFDRQPDYDRASPRCPHHSRFRGVDYTKSSAGLRTGIVLLNEKVSLGTEY